MSPAGAAAPHYVHLTCALWVPDVTLAQPSAMAGAVLDGLAPDRADLTCSVCKQARIRPMQPVRMHATPAMLTQHSTLRHAGCQQPLSWWWDCSLRNVHLDCLCLSVHGLTRCSCRSVDGPV